MEPSYEDDPVNFEVVAVNRSAAYFLLASGDVCRITLFIGPDGEETDNRTIAVAAVGELPNGHWAAIDLSEFQATSVH